MNKVRKDSIRRAVGARQFRLALALLFLPEGWGALSPDYTRKPHPFYEHLDDEDFAIMNMDDEA